VEITVYILFSFVVSLVIGVNAIARLALALEAEHEGADALISRRECLIAKGLLALWLLGAVLNWGLVFYWLRGVAG